MNTKPTVFRTAGKLGENEKSSQLDQKPLTYWISGLSGSGKSTLAYALEAHLHECGIKTVVLDGDNLRHGLNQDLDFSHKNRSEAIRRAAEVAKLFNDVGMVVIVSLISPFLQNRAQAASIIGKHQFVEIYMNTPIEVCEARDTKGVYIKARKGELKYFTGISSPYEAPFAPDFSLNASQSDPTQHAEIIFTQTKSRILER